VEAERILKMLDETEFLLISFVSKHTAQIVMLYINKCLNTNECRTYSVLYWIWFYIS